MRGSGVASVQCAKFNAQLPSFGGDLMPEKTAFAQVLNLVAMHDKHVLLNFSIISCTPPDGSWYYRNVQ
jgi:hypothetical protein